METKQYFYKQTWFWLLIGIIFIVFSFFAPYVFTHFHTGIDFSNTGEIGDTIGGIMNPFIAIAGVIATFLAFIMQVRANKIQSQQFIKSFNKDTVDAKIDSYYKMKLLSIDLNNTLTDIDTRIENIDKYINALKSNPYPAVVINRSPLSLYDRFQTYDRVDIFKGFKLFITSNTEWLDLFNSLYNKLEYLPESFKLVYTISDQHNSDAYDDKLKIRDMLIALDRDCIKNRNIALNSGHAEIQSFFETYITSYRKEIDMNKEGAFKDIKQYLSKLSEQLHTIKSPEFEKLRSNISEIIIVMNTIEQKTNQLFPQFELFKEELVVKDGNVKSELEKIKTAIDTELENISIDSIQDEYDTNSNK